MQAMNSQGKFDLIVCGRQTTDGDTAQVSGELAQWLGIPHCNWVSELQEIREDGVIFWQKTDAVRREIEAAWPCLLSVEKSSVTPRMPSLKLKIAGKKKTIIRIGLEDLEDQNPEHYGLKGSATRVRKIFPPEKVQRQAVRRMDGNEAARYIAKILENG